jgi:small subunit ribosomal protein S19
MAERIAFKGMTPTQAATLTMEQYLELVSSRNRRSIRRNSMDYKKLAEKVEKFKKNNTGKSVRTHIREAVILPSWIGVKFEVHNGKEFQTANMYTQQRGCFTPRQE